MLPAGDGARSRTAGLVRLGAGLVDQPVSEIECLADLLTARDDDAYDATDTAGQSSLSADGTPLQLCLTSRAEGWDLRLIGDPATHLANPEARARASRAAIAPVLEVTRAHGLTPLIDRSWQLLLPAPGGFGPYIEGVTWFGAALRQPGCAVYFDATKGALTDRWQRIETWLETIAGPGASRAVARLRDAGVPMAAGVEGVDSRYVRLKLYWRLAQVAPLAAFGLPLLTDPAMDEFLAMLVGGREIDGDGLVLAVGLHPRDGSVIDVKADICGHHCLGYSEAEWIERLDALAAHFGLAPLPVARAFERGARVSYVGFGLDAGGGARLNLYLGAPA